MRRLDFNEIKEKAKTDASNFEQVTLTGKTSAMKNAATSATGTGTKK